MFADQIFGIFCVNLVFNRKQTKAMFMERNCDRFAKK